MPSSTGNKKANIVAERLPLTLQAYRLLVKTMQEEFGEIYPLHLGVTEAGDGEDGPRRRRDPRGDATPSSRPLGDSSC